MPPEALVPAHPGWRDAFEEAAADVYPSGAVVGATLMSPRAIGNNPSPFADTPVADTADPAPGLVGWPAYRAELASIASLAVPLSLSNLMGLVISLVAIGFVGRLGAFELSVVVTSTSIFNVSGLSVLTGFASAMETLTGQAYGAGHYSHVGVVLQRALLLTTLLTAALGVLWTGADRALILLGQDPDISRSARYYLLTSLGALWCQGVFENLKRYLMAQGVAAPVTAATLVGVIAAPAFNWLFIYRCDMRLLGAALAMDAVGLVMVATLAGAVVARDRRLAGTRRATWAGLSREALGGWGEYVRYALPSVLMICCEWWTFEAVILLSGLLPDPPTSLSAMGIAVDTSGAQFMLISGVGMALSSRVSNSLGAGKPAAARRAVGAALTCTLAAECAIAAAIALNRERWARVFTDVPAVVAATVDLLLLVVATLPGDGTNATLQGLLRGAGRQEIGAVANICSYWGIGIPMAAFLGIKRNLGLRGLWWGLVIVNLLQGCVMLGIASTINLSEAADKAAARFEQRRSLTQAQGEEPLLAADRLEAGPAAGEV
ncbi:hypothetical protein ACKKBG_A25485 [Auxenochlorella protothecoides x Auxenochlorella symbiontica]